MDPNDPNAIHISSLTRIKSGYRKSCPESCPKMKIRFVTEQDVPDMKINQSSECISAYDLKREYDECGCILSYDLDNVICESTNSDQQCFSIVTKK